MEANSEIVLGKTYKDVITGFVGVATGFVQYISGCNQALLSPKVSESGAIQDSHWFDVQRLKVQYDDQVVLDNGATPGCDRMAPKR